MRLIGNVIWFVFGGLLAAFLWVILGLLLMITIIGIPFALQCFKMGKLVLWPFGKVVNTRFEKHPIANILWAALFGWEMALFYLGLALVFAITIVGIPFALQWVKLASLSILPFGATIK